MEAPLGRRIVVVGTSGSGKTTLAKRIAECLGVPHIELDAIRHRPGWIEAPRDEFRIELVEHLEAAADGWVVDGNYRDLGADIVWPRADCIVWLDLRRWLVMRQVIVRTARRIVSREQLWNGNREGIGAAFGRDSIIRWAWTTYTPNRTRYAELMAGPTKGDPPIVQLRSHVEAEALLEQFGSARSM